MRFGIRTLDELDVKGKTVLCRVDINQPVDRATGTLKHQPHPGLRAHGAGACGQGSKAGAAGPSGKRHRV